jgi:hypothetical protein
MSVRATDARRPTTGVGIGYPGPERRGRKTDPEGLTMSICTRKTTAHTAVVATASAIASIGLITVPAPAQASCGGQFTSDWDWKPTAFAIEQDNQVEVHLYSKTHEASYNIPNKTDMTKGTYYGTINDRSINFTVNWKTGPGAGLSNNYTGQIDDNGIARGTSTNSQGATNSWESFDKLVCKPAPSGSAHGEAPDQGANPDDANPGGANPPAAKPNPAPVTNAITLSFGPASGLLFVPDGGSITATIKNSSDLTASCHYSATPGGFTDQDFTVDPKGSKDLPLTGTRLSIKYHAVVSCHDASGQQPQEIGHAERDVTF